MSHNPNPNADTSGFNYPSAAGKPTNLDQTHVGIVPTSTSSATESSSSVTVTQTLPLGPVIDVNHGKLGGEHGGSGTRTDDRKGELVKDVGDTTTSVATHDRKQQ